MPRLSAAAITLTPEQEADLRGLARAKSAGENSAQPETPAKRRT